MYRSHSQRQQFTDGEDMHISHSRGIVVHRRSRYAQITDHIHRDSSSQTEQICIDNIQEGQQFIDEADMHRSHIAFIEIEIHRRRKYAHITYRIHRDSSSQTEQICIDHTHRDSSQRTEQRVFQVTDQLQIPKIFPFFLMEKCKYAGAVL